MKKNVILSISLILLALTFGSCRRMAEEAIQKIRIEAVEDFRLIGLTNAEMGLRIANDTRHNIKLNEAELTIHYKERPVITLQLQGGIKINKRTTETIATRWKLKAEVLAIMLVARDIRNDDPSQIRVSFRIEGHSGLVGFDISQEKMPLSEFLPTFGLTWQEFKKRIQSQLENIIPQ